MRNKRIQRRGATGSKGGVTDAHPIVRPTTEAFSFSPPEELNERMMLCTAWAYLRRGALLVREVCAHSCCLTPDMLSVPMGCSC